MFPSSAIYKAGTSLDWDGDTKDVCVLKFANKDIIFCWVSSHICIRGNEKQDCCKSALGLFHVSRFVYPIAILNIISANTFFPLVMIAVL